VNPIYIEFLSNYTCTLDNNVGKCFLQDRLFKIECALKENEGFIFNTHIFSCAETAERKEQILGIGTGCAIEIRNLVQPCNKNDQEHVEKLLLWETILKEMYSLQSYTASCTASFRRHENP
jgi:hypothetical protein